MTDDRDRTYLVHILERGERILEYTQGGREAFMDDEMVRDAVVRNFEVIGEAAKQVSEETRARYDSVPWRRIAGFRDVLIHGYMGVDPREVWAVVDEDLDELLDSIRAIFDDQGWKAP